MGQNLPVVVQIAFGLLTIINGIGLFFLTRLLNTLKEINDFMQSLNGRMKSVEAWKEFHEDWAAKEHTRINGDIQRIEGRQFDDTFQGRERRKRTRP